MPNELTEILKKQASEYNLKNYIHKKDNFCNEFVNNFGYKCICCGGDISPATSRFYKNKFTTWKINQFGTKEFEKIDEKFFSSLKCYQCQKTN